MSSTSRSSDSRRRSRTSSSRSLCGRSRTPRTRATALTTSCGSNTGARSTNQAPSRVCPAVLAATSIASRVFPDPPAPVKVTRRAPPSSAASSASSRSRPTKLVSWSSRLWRRASTDRSRGNSRGRSGCSSWKRRSGRSTSRSRCTPEIPQARPRREVLARQFAHGRGHQDLAAVRERADRGAADHGDPAAALGLHLSGVQRDPQPAWRSLDFERARQRVRGAREHRAGRAFLASLLVRRPAARRHGRGDQLLPPPGMPRAVLDVGEHDRHRRLRQRGRLEQTGRTPARDRGDTSTSRPCGPRARDARRARAAPWRSGARPCAPRARRSGARARPGRRWAGRGRRGRPRGPARGR